MSSVLCLAVKCVRVACHGAPLELVEASFPVSVLERSSVNRNTAVACVEDLVK